MIQKNFFQNSKDRMNRAFNTTLVGFGNVAALVMKDKRMSRYIKYQAHAQVLKSNKNFNWNAVIEPDRTKREIAKSKWKIGVVVDSFEKLPSDHKIDVLVVTTPPDRRISLLPYLKKVRKAIILEKPISECLKNSLRFKKKCEELKLKVQVNLFRRLDNSMIEVKEKILKKKIGKLQAGFCIYGNGIYNNALHMIDLVRMLFGEISSVQAIQSNTKLNNCTLKGDLNLPFLIQMENGKNIFFQPINFSFYRDIYLDIWGEKGRLEIFQEGLFYRYSQIGNHRAIDNIKEVSIDKMKYKKTQCGNAYYNIYQNLSDHLKSKKKLLSSIESAIRSERVVNYINESKKKNYQRVRVVY